MKDVTNLIGRVFMAYIFVVAGWGKLSGFSGTEQYFQHLGIPALLVAPVILIELGGGIALILGLFTRWVALVLAGFCLATAFLVHFHPGNTGQMINFMKNFAMAGGFLILAANGAGRFSLDTKFGLPGRG